MQTINWLELEPLPADLEALHVRLDEALPLRDLCRRLVEVILRAYPWRGRTDLVACYHPAHTYEAGQRLGLLIPESQNTRTNRMLWLLAHVKQTRLAENPVQGKFQVLTLDLHGKQVQMAAGIPDASYPEPDLSNYTPEDLAWLADWVSNTYGAALQATLRKLIQKGKIRGQLAGQTFVPEGASALSVELLHSAFGHLTAARPWISLEDMLKGLPDLAQLERETVLALIRATLAKGPYQGLGADRWTTAERFGELDRDIPRGLTTPGLRSTARIWTKRDEQDLAGYGRKFMPQEARHALEELESGERLPEPDASPWRPPGKPVRLATLNYLHLTQAYFPVGDCLRVFAPELQLVFVQFIDGEHQPFLLDRENGLLKAIHPDRLRTKILNDGIPAGTHLWLEYEKNEKYRIAPRPLPFKRMVPCKLASLKEDSLQIQHTHISMKYEGDPSLFKAELRNEEVQALLARAQGAKLSVRDAMIYAVQEICATDPDHRAYWLDIFNTVFLIRVGSPLPVSFLLYTQPCFEPLGGGYFRYKPTPTAGARKNRKQTERLAQLWEGLLSNPLPPNPRRKDKIIVPPRLEVSVPVSAALIPDRELPSVWEREPESEIPVTALPLAVVEADTALREEERIESFVVSQEESEGLTPTQTDLDEPASHPWRDSLERLIHSLVELQDPEHVEATSLETQVPSTVLDEDPRPESISLLSPFRWEPKPAWLDPPAGQKAPFPEAVDPTRFVYRPRIPLRPFHKQRFYRRFFFYLRGWLSRIFRKTV